MKNKLILTAALGILLGGCAKDETAPGAPDNILPADGIIRIYPDVDDHQTRAEGMTTGKLQNYLITMHTAGLGNTNWTYSPDAGWTPDNQLLWNRANQEVEVMAWLVNGHEVNIPTEGNPTVIDFTGDQSAPGVIIAVDYLYASSPVKPSEPNPANDIYYDPAQKGLVLHMKHWNAKLKIKIDLSPAFNAPQQGNATTTNPLTNVTVNGTGTLGTIYATELDKLSASNPQPIPPFMDAFTPGIGTDLSAPDTRGATVWYECIVLAQTVPLEGEDENLSVSFHINGEEYTWTSPDPVTFASGKEYILPLTVQPKVATAAAATTTGRAATKVTASATIPVVAAEVTAAAIREKEWTETVIVREDK